MKKFKRCLCIFSLMLFSLLLIPGNNAAASKGNIKGVNYDLVMVKGTTIEYPLSVKIGEMTFDGTVKRDAEVLDDNLDEYIVNYINECNIDMLMLSNCEDVVDMYTKELDKLERNQVIDVLETAG